MADQDTPNDSESKKKRGGKVGGYTEDELEKMLAETGTVPPGVSYDPYSATPFSVATGDEAE